jgi:hypothetical protein
MFGPVLKYLHLRTSILYEKIAYMQEEIGQILQNMGEILLCYRINPGQGGSIEPDREFFLGQQVFAGIKSSVANAGENPVLLPEGVYLFTQTRGFLEKGQWLEMALEQQKDGLWERNKLEDTLYARYLYEDGSVVTQALRPVLKP